MDSNNSTNIESLDYDELIEYDNFDEFTNNDNTNKIWSDIGSYIIKKTNNSNDSIFSYCSSTCTFELTEFSDNENIENFEQIGLEIDELILSDDDDDDDDNIINSSKLTKTSEIIQTYYKIKFNPEINLIDFVVEFSNFLNKNSINYKTEYLNHEYINWKIYGENINYIISESKLELGKINEITNHFIVSVHIKTNQHFQQKNTIINEITIELENKYDNIIKKIIYFLENLDV